MKIRKASIKDWTAIKALNQQLFFNDKTYDNTLDVSWPDKNEKYFKDRIRGKKTITFVAELNNQIVGYLIASIKKAEAYRTIKKLAELENMFVIQKYRGQGIGSELINYFFKWAHKERIERVQVIASSSNLKAIALYRKKGFQDYTVTLEKNI
jgi:ribosomal protein S18 acetylase RimI-like enzyme